MFTQINCPNCQQPIAINVKRLVAGDSFSCKGCSAKVSLAGESSNVVTKAVNSFEKVAAQAKH
ncbi:MAG: hypothetical protein HUJ16_01405 [Kangiella sp.]|nr:hypothetical protein [Kangiella sp.]